MATAYWTSSATVAGGVWRVAGEEEAGGTTPPLPATRHPPPATLREGAAVAAVLGLCLAILFRDIGRWTTHLPGHNDTRMFVGVLQWDAEALRQGRRWREFWQLPCLYPQHNMLACSEHMLGSAALFAPSYF